MKAIILAAGMGTRLGTLIPKPLTSLMDEKTILDFQIEKLEKQFGRHNIMLIVGYKKELIMEKHPDLVFVYNHAYTQTNTAKSLHLALKKVEDDAVWLNGDVFFDENLLNILQQSPTSACLVDRARCGEEEIKYTLDADGHILELSKKVVNPVGEAVGINLIRKPDLDALRAELEAVANDAYFEKALENLTMAGRLRLKAIDLQGHYCKEIDFEEDLAAVRDYMNQNLARPK